MQMNEELEGERSQHKVTELTKRLGKSEKKVQQLTLESAELQKQVGIHHRLGSYIHQV